jgi:hypothetical protein
VSVCERENKYLTKEQLDGMVSWSVVCDYLYLFVYVWICVRVCL